MTKSEALDAFIETEPDQYLTAVECWSEGWNAAWAASREQAEIVTRTQQHQISALIEEKDILRGLLSLREEEISKPRKGIEDLYDKTRR